MNRYLTSFLPEPMRPQVIAERRWRRLCGNRVLSGPFAGMHYVGESAGSAFAPKIFGTYEAELHGVVEEMCAGRPARIVDIGAAEGYYAVGLATRCAQATVVAFEREARARELLATMARANGVCERLAIQGECSADTLRTALAGDEGCLVCDIEGGELRVLDGALVAALARWTLLVETHDYLVPGTEATLRQRFSPTHKIREVASRPRARADLPPSLRHWLMDRWMARYLEEFRPAAMTWLFMQPKTRAGK